MKIQRIALPAFIIGLMLLVACGSAVVDGPAPTGPDHIYHGTESVQVWNETGLCFRNGASFEKDSKEVIFLPGDAFYPVNGITVTLNLQNGTLTGDYKQGTCPDDQVAVTPVNVVVTYATPASDNTEPVPAEEGFVYAHGKSFPNYIVQNRDYRELTVEDVYKAVIERGFSDEDELVIAHSDQVRELQESTLAEGSYDTGKALILVGDIPRLKTDKSFMIVSSDVYSQANPGGSNLPLQRFTP